MADIKTDLLEKLSMDGYAGMEYGRHQQMASNKYTAENKYGATHPDARADGDQQGKGTGVSGGITPILPHTSSMIGSFAESYANWDTENRTDGTAAGNCSDNEARKEMLTRRLYQGTDDSNTYSAKLVVTQKNVDEGQYRVPTKRETQEHCDIHSMPRIS